MNPLELQVLSIVCGVVTDQYPPASEVRMQAVAALPPQKVATVSRNERRVWAAFLSQRPARLESRAKSPKSSAARA
jgi:hypothetical protein